MDIKRACQYFPQEQLKQEMGIVFDTTKSDAPHTSVAMPV
jgi:hypothetical protein